MGEDLRIIGMKNSEAVLSSNNTTYALKRVETSNCGKAMQRLRLLLFVNDNDNCCL